MHGLSRELLEGVFGAVRRGFSRCPLAVGRMRPVLALSSHLLVGCTLRGSCFRPVTVRERCHFLRERLLTVRRVSRGEPTSGLSQFVVCSPSFPLGTLQKGQLIYLLFCFH